jgi:hypothetical protein
MCKRGWIYGPVWQSSIFQTGPKLHPLVSSPTILSANMRDMFHFFLVFTYFQKIFVVYIMMPYEL